MLPFELPALPYAYKALAPYIDEKTMMLHHKKHHQSYINKLKAALSQTSGSTPKTLVELIENIDHYNSAVRNHGGGHYNHTLFWESLTPAKGQEPTRELAAALRNDFGGIAHFINHFSAQAQTLFGSGWTWLYCDKNGKLQITNLPNQDNPLMDKERYGIPLLGLDVWEHAYYLRYQNRRPDYIEAFWHIIDWAQVKERYITALAIQQKK